MAYQVEVRPDDAGRQQGYMLTMMQMMMQVQEFRAAKERAARDAVTEMERIQIAQQNADIQQRQVAVSERDVKLREWETSPEGAKYLADRDRAKVIQGYLAKSEALKQLPKDDPIRLGLEAEASKAVYDAEFSLAQARREQEKLLPTFAGKEVSERAGYTPSMMWKTPIPGQLLQPLFSAPQMGVGAIMPKGVYRETTDKLEQERMAREKSAKEVRPTATQTQGEGTRWLDARAPILFSALDKAYADTATQAVPDYSTFHSAFNTELDEMVSAYIQSNPKADLDPTFRNRLQDILFDRYPSYAGWFREKSGQNTMDAFFDRKFQEARNRAEAEKNARQ